MGKYLRLAAICLGLAIPHMGVQAMTASQTVQVERIVKLADGTVQVKYEKPDTVVPGDRLVYTVNYLNDKNETSESLRLDMPVPEQLTYIDGSADIEGADVVYSIDGGQNYALRPDLIVSDAQGNRRAAKAEDITHIRWTLINDVLPGESGAVKFRARLK